MNPSARTIWVAAAIAGAIMWPAAAAAQPARYPVRAVRIVSPYPPGGAVDAATRPVAQKLNEAWGQPVIIDNRPGAGTMIGTEMVVRAAPDGYTLLSTSAVIATNVSLLRLPFDPVADLAPVSLLVQTPYVIAVHPSLPVKSVRDFVVLARAKPGEILYASSGSGTSTHLAMEMLKSLAKIDVMHVSYKGGTQAITASISGEVQAIFNTITALLPQARSGKLRALAVSNARRVVLAPDLPTVAESGVPGFEMTGWYAMFAPAGTPRAVVNQINADVNHILQQPDVRERFLATGNVPLGGTPEALRDYLKLEIARWGKVIREGHVTAE